MTKRSLVSLTASIALALALSACGGGSDSSGGGGDDLGTLTAGTLTVCSDVPYEPFDVAKGKTFTGFDGDVITEIAKRLDLKVNLKDQSFDGLQSGLARNSNQCDIVASAMTITPEREKKIAFSKPYYDSEQSLLVAKGSPIKTIDDLAGKKVGVQQGTTGKTYTDENAPKTAKVVSFPADPDMYSALLAGQVDALLQDLPVNLEHTKDGKYEVVQKYDTGEQYGFALRKKGSEKLLAAVNKELAAMKKDGSYQKIYDSYFKTDAAS